MPHSSSHIGKERQADSINTSYWFCKNKKDFLSGQRTQTLRADSFSVSRDDHEKTGRWFIGGGGKWEGRKKAGTQENGKDDEQGGSFSHSCHLSHMYLFPTLFHFPL